MSDQYPDVMRMENRQGDWDTLQVSNMGQVRVQGKATMGYLKSDGPQFRYVMIEGEEFPVHELVAISFGLRTHDNLDDFISHIDKDLSNNTLDNLKMISKKDFVAH